MIDLYLFPVFIFQQQHTIHHDDFANLSTDIYIINGQ